MKFPRLKNALLCRILVYVVVLGSFIAPIVIAANLNFIPLPVKVIIGIVFTVLLLVYMIKNFALLMVIDVKLALLHCSLTARKHFSLPRSFSVKRVEKRILRCGRSYTPTYVLPYPHIVVYKSGYPFTVYSSGTERVALVYHAELLDKELYRSVVNSATANSEALKGKKKHSFLDKEQRRAPLNRVSVIFIFAESIEEKFREALSSEVTKNGGNGIDTATLPCVVDLENRRATFDSVRLPYVGYGYPVKNRGIRLIRKCLFGGRLPYADSPDTVDAMDGMDTSQSLWSFCRSVKRELILDKREAKKRYDKMKHKELTFEDGYVYLKWEDRGVWLLAVTDEETRTVEIDAPVSWYYPKPNMIAKETVKAIEEIIRSHFAELGYTVKYIRD